MDISRSDITVITPKGLESGLPVFAAFTVRNPDLNRQGEVPGLNLGLNTPDTAEAVHSNRRLLLEQLDIDPDRLALADQVHGTRVKQVAEGGIWPETDALVTATPGLFLGIQVADCAAVLFWDDGGTAVAAAHAGWRGAAGGILKKTVGVLEREGIRPEDLRAFISPCISERYFEVGEEVARQFPDPVVNRDAYEQPHVNLKAFVHMQLVESGLATGRIETHPGCTYGEGERFYSWRREGSASGRMMALIGMRE